MVLCQRGGRCFARPTDQRLHHRDPVGQGIEQRPRLRLQQSRQRLPPKGQHDRAIQDYDQAIKLNPSYAIAYNNRGFAYGAKGEHDRAIQDLRPGHQARPERRHAYDNRGFAYGAKGQHDRAIQDYDQAIKLNPNFALAYNNRGLAYGAKGQHDRAIQDYDQAIKLDPNKSPRYQAGKSSDRCVGKPEDH